MGAFTILACLITLLTARSEETSIEETARLEFFEKQVRPLLVNHCYNCHSADTKPSGGLRVDDLNGLLTGGDEGPAIIAGDPEKSLLLKLLKHSDAKKRMPQESDPLSGEQIAILEQWIREGAAWPRERIPASLGRTKAEYEELKAKHWAWQPLAQLALPPVQNTAWPRSDVDHFIMAALEANQLSPVADADRLTLIRRLTFDLTGLPPTSQGTVAFQNDPSPSAYETLVDRLLASPAFAEHWARHWLDVARYGESTGPSRNVPYPHAWKYRDYVIDALHRDVPLDRFIQEQIAGDLLAADTPAERDRLLTATGFLALGSKDVNQRFKTRFLMDNADEKIDTVTRSVLGLTASCARCHDHKFDPIPISDYYALAGIFTSTDDCAGVRNKMGGGGLDYYDPSMLVKLSTEVPAPPSDEIAKLKAEVEEAKKAWDAIRGTPEGLKPAANGQPTQRPFRVKYEKLEVELRALTDPAARGHVVHGVREAKLISDTEVRIRGEAERLGPKVPRGFLSIPSMVAVAPIEPTQSGRLQLAQWLTSPTNPLTPRVQANRIWAHLFGQGLVSSVDNFGVKGDTPSHPELLDFLANQLIGGSWSLKKFVRSLVLTRAYQLSSAASEPQRAKDPDNRFLWRHTPRRLSAEELRDAILASTENLQGKPAEGSASMPLKMIEMLDNGPEAKQIHKSVESARYRSLYLPLLRGVTPAPLEAFDPVSQSLVPGKRDSTTVPTQALFLLNGSFVREQSLALAERVSRENERFDAEWIRQLYLRILSRNCTEQEMIRASDFLTDYASLFRQSKDGDLATPSVAALPAGEAGTSETPPAANPDDMERPVLVPPPNTIQPKDAKSAAWMNLIQALYASAEFRFVR